MSGDLYDRLLADARSGCECGARRKPCIYHEGYGVGVEAAIAARPADLRIVDVGGTGLPRWPDLAELRARVAELPDPEDHEWTPVEQAAWKLVRLVDAE